WRPRPEPSAALMACAAAGVGEGLASDRDELPAVAPVGQGQLQDPPRAAVTHLAVGKWRPKRVQAPAPRPHDNRANPAHRVQLAVRGPAREPLVLIAVACDRRLGPVLVRRLPQRLHFAIAAVRAP